MRSERGFTYLLLLFFVALIGAGLAVAGDVWKTTVQRERESELLFAGDAFRLAIAGYYMQGRQYPASLEDLLKDPRSPDTRRHLRMIYPDPFSGKNDWVLIKAPQGGIMGVAIPSTDAPLKRSGFDGIDRVFEEQAVRLKEKLTYRDWEFVFDPAMINNGLFGAKGF